MVLMPCHVVPFSREHAGYAMLFESFIVVELREIMLAPSLGFGIVEVLGLGLELGSGWRSDRGKRKTDMLEAHVD